MSKEQEDIDLIERHLSGKLTHAEAVDFETRLGEDHEFARKLRLRKTFPSLFKAEGHDEIVMDLSETPEPVVRKKKVRSQKSRNIAWTIMVLILIGLITYFLISVTGWPSGQSPEQKPVAAAKKAEVRPNVPLKATAKPEAPAPTSAVPSTAQPTEKPATRETAFGPEKAIVLETPADGMVFNRSDELVFRWSIKTDTFTNFYLISETSEKLAWWRGIRPGTRECIIPANKLSSGRFYWYVGRKEYMRRITINP